MATSQRKHCLSDKRTQALQDCTQTQHKSEHTHKQMHMKARYLRFCLFVLVIFAFNTDLLLLLHLIAEFTAIVLVVFVVIVVPLWLQYLHTTICSAAADIATVNVFAVV